MRSEHDAVCPRFPNDGVEEGRRGLRGALRGGKHGRVGREAVSPVHREVSELAAPFDEEEGPGVDLWKRDKERKREKEKSEFFFSRARRRRKKTGGKLCHLTSAIASIASTYSSCIPGPWLFGPEDQRIPRESGSLTMSCFPFLFLFFKFEKD